MLPPVGSSHEFRFAHQTKSRRSFTTPTPDNPEANADVLQQTTNYLDKPFALATLREHRENDLNRRSAFAEEALRFLRTGEVNVIIQESVIRRYDLPNLHRAIKATFPEWECIDEREGPDNRMSLFRSPTYSRFKKRQKQYLKNINKDSK